MKVGDSFEYVFKTGHEHSARHLGSGDVDVLSTPSMILFMEEACRRYSDEGLRPKETTVGIHVDVYHFKAAPTGSEIKVRGKLLSMDGRRLTFWVEAWWGDVKIGQGLHERYIVNREEFIRRLRGGQ